MFTFQILHALFVRLILRPNHSLQPPFRFNELGLTNRSSQPSTCCKLSIHAVPNCQSAGWLSSISLSGMSELLTGKVQAGFGKASHWLKLFNVAYSEKLAISVFPGSLNIALDHVFAWFVARYEAHRIWFGREEYGGERDILLLPCELVSLDHRRAFLWTPTTAVRDRRDPWVVEVVADVNLRDHFGLQDGNVVEIRVPTSGVQR